LKNRLAAVLVLLAALPAGAADIATELRESAGAVIRADELLDKERLSEINLDKEVATLTRLIESGALNVPGLSIAHNWRARAYSTINWARMKKGEQPDGKLAQESLADFEKVIANGIDVAGWGVSISNVLYSAGTVARNHLEDHERAYRYWRRCAAMGHAGCLNIMASAHLTGAGGIRVDLNESIELNKKVYETGTDYRCAGAFSAVLIAETIHFAGLKPSTVDEFEWLKRAYLLLDELGQREKLDNPCDYARFVITEYLMRLARGESRPELLRSAAKRSGDNDFRPLVQYLLRERTRESFQASLDAIPLKHMRCYVNFLAFWHAAIEKQDALAEAHFKSMSALGGDHCAIEIGLIKLRKR
jgi:TPR repeat protein